jgi:hypothetical protein
MDAPQHIAVAKNMVRNYLAMDNRATTLAAAGGGAWRAKEMSESADLVTATSRTAIAVAR